MTKLDPKDALVTSWLNNYPKQAFENVFVVGLAGYIGAGKTTVAESLRQLVEGSEGGLETCPKHFSERLKQTLKVFTNQPDNPFTSPSSKQARIYGESEMTVRDWLTSYATDFVRDKIGENYWLDVIADELSQIDRPTLVTIDDHRFPNEVNLIESIGVGVLIERGDVGQSMQHRSERPERLNIKNVIDNNASPEVAAQAVLKVVEACPRYQQIKAKAKSMA